MKIIQIKRKTKYQKKYYAAMGLLNSRIITVKKYFLFTPFKTLYQHKEIYNSPIKNCNDCNLFI